MKFLVRALLRITIGICIIILIFYSVGYVLFFFSDDEKLKRSFPKCEDKVEYTDGGFGDYVDCDKYYYTTENIVKFKDNANFKVVTENDIQNIYGYFEYYEESMKYSNFKGKYTFDKEKQINAGDYYYIDTLEGKPIGQSFYGKYDNYDVYYVDVDEKTMYHIHINT